MEEHEKIELRSEEVQEILGTPPSWIVRWGTVVVFAGVIVLGIVSWIVRYPDAIRAPLAVTTATPPVNVMSRSTGYLDVLKVKENELVKKDQILGILKNPAKYEDVQSIDKEVNDLTLDIGKIGDYRPNKRLMLGEIQNAYSNFIQIFEEYNFKISRNFDQQSIGEIGNAINNSNKSIQLAKENKNIIRNKLELATREFKRQQRLYTENLNKASDLEDAKAKIYELEEQLRSADKEILSANANIIQMNKQVLEIRNDKTESNSNNYVRLVEALNQLRTRIDEWKLSYLLTAPVDGIVSFPSDNVNEKVNVNANEPVLAILPENGESILAKVALPIRGSGKVKEGQRVIVKFDSYPFQEHGIVEGIVSKKSLMPQNNQALAIQVSFPKGLKTTYGLDLPFSQQMSGTAEIITEDRRFISRIFDKFLSAFKNN